MVGRSARPSPAGDGPGRLLAATSAVLLVGAGILVGSMDGLSPTGLLALALGAVGIVMIWPRGDASPAPSGVRQDGWAIVEHELQRARRYSRRLSLVRLEVTGTDSGAMSADTLAARLSDNVRALDAVWVQDGAVWLLLPEGDRQMALSSIGRFEATHPGLLSATLMRTATFPDDALTAGALLAAVQGSKSQPIQLPTRSTEVGDPVLGEAARMRGARG